MRLPTPSRARTWTALADELGDLQLQVVFHAQMAEEAGLFTFDDVIDRICDKMERRHPHIFGDAEHGGHHLWEQIKAEERAVNPDKSALAGVALALPALERAAKLQRRAARVGFDWPDASGPRARSTKSWRSWTPRPSTSASSRSWATCCSPSSTSHGISTSSRKPRCAKPIANSSAASGQSSRSRGLPVFRWRKRNACGTRRKRLRPTPSPETAPNCRATVEPTAPFRPDPISARSTSPRE